MDRYGDDAPHWERLVAAAIAAFVASALLGAVLADHGWEWVR